MDYELNRLAEILDTINPEHATWVRESLALWHRDADATRARLNSKQMWGGAESIANDALADNPGMNEWQWEALIREYRSLMIDIATELKSQPRHYPDIDFWLSSFTSWNSD